jgi:hypothetical protein
MKRQNIILPLSKQASGTLVSTGNYEQSISKMRIPPTLENICSIPDCEARPFRLRTSVYKARLLSARWINSIYSDTQNQQARINILRLPGHHNQGGKLKTLIAS